MPLLVTRPQPQADQWVARIVELEKGPPAAEVSIDARAMPLIEIRPSKDRELLARAWSEVPQCAMVMFVSTAAVDSFFDGRPAMPKTDAAHPSWPSGVYAAATGPGTAASLVARQVPARQIIQPAAEVGQVDSEALWQRLSTLPWSGTRAMIVRGDGGRDWLAERLVEQGASVQFIQAYSRETPVLDADRRAWVAAAQAWPHDWCWLFSSSDAIARLSEIAPNANWSQSTAWTTHPRIAASARAAGFGAVEVVGAHPRAVAAAVQAWIAARHVEPQPGR
jgi:uroporphyrinogen-III synthase